MPNFHEINPQLLRGAQPSDEGFRNLAKLGVKTIIDLREPGERSGAEKKVVEADGMRYISIPMKGFHMPTEEQVSKVLALFNDPSAGPVFVHCRRGADRTGTVVACYRISHDHWQNDKALKEAREMGMSWLQKSMQHYIMDFRIAPDPVAKAPAQGPALIPATAVN